MRAWAIVLFVASVAGFARAEPPTDQSIDQLLFVTRAQENHEGAMASVRASMGRFSTSMPGLDKLSAEKKQALEESQARTAEAIASALSWEKMKPLLITLYRDVLNQEEVNGLIAFYQSPAGTAYIEKMPLIREKSLKLMQERMAPLMARLTAAAMETKPAEATK